MIEGFHAKINDALMGNHICAFVLINVPPKSYESFCRFCEETPSIVEHSHIVGLNNGLLKIRGSDSEELEALLRQMRQFGLSNTSVLLSTYFTQKPFSETEHLRKLKISQQTGRAWKSPCAGPFLRLFSFYGSCLIF